jgi:threonine dehydrogenase-like Zn-dependent dehydrogenase
VTRVVKSTAEGIAVVERDGPPGSGVLLEMAAVSICGTDLHLARIGARPGADVVIEATGSDTGMARCCELVRPAGRIVLVGVFHGMVPFPALVALQKEIVLAGSTTYGRHQGRRETEEAASLLASEPEIAATLITHRYPLAEARQAFAIAGDRSSGSIKVVIEP